MDALGVGVGVLEGSEMRERAMLEAIAAALLLAFGGRRM
jgi:hypothetical protein